MTEQQQPARFVISVLIADRVGILRDVTSALTDLGANIDGISQTVVRGYFTVILTASFAAPISADAVESAIAGNFRKGEASIVVRPYDPKAEARAPARGDLYIITVTGRDRAGILKAATAFLASKGINIEDWYVIFEDSHVTHIGEITVPDKLDIKQVQDEFGQLMDAMELRTYIQHDNIFRATNEVGPIKVLLSEKL